MKKLPVSLLIVSALILLGCGSPIADSDREPNADSSAETESDDVDDETEMVDETGEEFEVIEKPAAKEPLPNYDPEDETDTPADVKPESGNGTEF